MHADLTHVEGACSMSNKSRMSSQDFLKMLDALWSEGPKVSYTSPESWRSPL